MIKPSGATTTEKIKRELVRVNIAFKNKRHSPHLFEQPFLLGCGKRDEHCKRDKRNCPSRWKGELSDPLASGLVDMLTVRRRPGKPLVWKARVATTLGEPRVGQTSFSTLRAEMTLCVENRVVLPTVE